ncbi:MAG: CPBP family intramembrane metalloprotease [Bacteroidota bacterium]|nr:CPBP family intramembrane metalloprotease [Bacteroidota bacterium]
MNRIPLLYKAGLLKNILYLILIITLSTIVILSIGVIIPIIFMGNDFVVNLTKLGEINNPDIISLNKYVQILSQIGMFIVPALFFAYLANVNISSYLRINRKVSVGIVLLGGLAMLAAFPFINRMAEWNSMMKLPSFMSGIEQWMKESEEKGRIITETFLNTSSLSGFLVNFIMIAVLAGLGEEFLFRGVIQKLFYDKIKNPHIAIIIAAFIFSAIHMQFYGFLPRFLMGIYLGYLFYWTGSIWTSVFAHLLNNGTAVVVSFLNNRKVINFDPDAIGTQSTSVIYLIASVILMTGFIYYIKQKSMKINCGEII